MKKVLLLLSISVLFQSCFSYKKMQNDPSQLQIEKYYRIKEDKKSSVVRIISKTDSSLVVWSAFETKTISVDKISKVEKRKFSIVKTVFLPIVIIGVVVAIFASAVQVKTGPIQSPP